MNRILYVNHNSNLRIIDQELIQTIRKDVTGGFGKCLKLNPKKDKVIVINDALLLSVIDLTSETFEVESTFEVKGHIDGLADWVVDDKHTIAYFLTDKGDIFLCDLKTHKQIDYNIVMKGLISTIKAERHFTSLAINYNKKLLAVSAITSNLTKKTNNILLYKIEPDPKGSIRLTPLTAVASSNEWDGSSLQ